jgi:hypothetical protein
MIKTKKLRSSDFSSELQQLLAETPLLNIETQRSYDDLEEAIREQMNPQDFFEELDVKEVVNAIWEGQRFQEQATELVNAEVTNNISKLATAHPLSAKMARRLQVTGDEIPSDVIGLGVYLNELGTNKTLVGAQAVLSAGRGYATLDKLVANRSARRKAAIKDFEFRRRRTKKDKEVPVKAKHKRTKLANDNRPAAKDSDWDD